MHPQTTHRSQRPTASELSTVSIHTAPADHGGWLQSSHAFSVSTQVKRRTPYDDIDPEQLIARDWLALSRSRLANERTLLAYIRTSLAMIGLGALLAKWIGHPAAVVGGVALAISGVLVIAIGLTRFVQENRRYRRLSSRPD